jgi:hypothetical protein
VREKWHGVLRKCPKNGMPPGSDAVFWAPPAPTGPQNGIDPGRIGPEKRESRGVKGGLSV